MGLPLLSLPLMISYGRSCASMGLPSVSHGSPVELHGCQLDVMRLPWASVGLRRRLSTSRGSLIGSHGRPWVLRGLPFVACGSLMDSHGLPWVSRRVPMGLMGLLSVSRRLHHGSPMGLPWVALGSPMSLSWGHMVVCAPTWALMGLLWPPIRLL